MDALYEIFREYIEDGGSVEVATEAIQELHRLKFPYIFSGDDVWLLIIMHESNPHDELLIKTNRMKQVQGELEETLQKLSENLGYSND